MRTIDKQLGLNHETFSNGDGLGGARAVKAVCYTLCNTKHPFNEEKRATCKKNCDAAYEVKVQLKEEDRLSGGVHKGLLSGERIEGGIPALKGKAQDSKYIDRGQNDGNGKGAKGAIFGGLSTGAKVAIGVGIIATLGLTVYIIRKRNK